MLFLEILSPSIILYYWSHCRFDDLTDILFHGDYNNMAQPGMLLAAFTRDYLFTKFCRENTPERTMEGVHAYLSTMYFSASGISTLPSSQFIKLLTNYVISHVMLQSRDVGWFCEYEGKPDRNGTLRSSTLMYSAVVNSVPF